MAKLVLAGVMLRAQMDERFPKRDTASDGWVGDSAHAARHSDHNPDARGWVHALDLDHHFGAPGDDERFLTQLLDYVRAGRDNGVVSYIVHDDRLAQASTNWRWEKNPSLEHHEHIHISFTRAAEHHGERFDLPIFRTYAPGEWDRVVPSYKRILAASEDASIMSQDTYRLACRLKALGAYTGTPALGSQGYPRQAVAVWQRQHGYQVSPAGQYGPMAHKLLFESAV